MVAPNGSWFTEVPRELRKHIYEFVWKNKVPVLKYESRASLFVPEKARIEMSFLHKKDSLGNLSEAIYEIQPNHIVSFGLEVADDEDLKILNKGCCLEDYVKASKYVHNTGAKVCANILLSPPGIEDPTYKAFITAGFGAEKMGAEEFLVMPCSPMKGTPAYDSWISGKWNPISATAASEIFRIIRDKYPQIKVRYLDLRIFTKHGRHGEFKRKPGKWSEAEKEKVREEVRMISNRVS